MRRLSRAMLPLLLLPAAGCGGAPPLPTAAPPVVASVAAPIGTSGFATRLRVGFPLRGLVDTIEVDVVDRLPLRSAELIAPDGAATPASYLTVDDTPRFATGQSALNNPWRGVIEPGGLLPALLAQNAQAGAAVRGHVQLLAMVSFAQIPLPDPVVYRRQWQQYRIRLRFGTPPDLETRVVPAPAPPPLPATTR